MFRKTDDGIVLDHGWYKQNEEQRMVKAMLRLHLSFMPHQDDGSTKALRSPEYIWLRQLSPPPTRAKALVCIGFRVEYESCLGVWEAFIRHLQTGPGRDFKVEDVPVSMQR